jgi:inner membrane protein
MLLVGAMVLFERCQVRRGSGPVDRLPVHVGWLIVLAYIGWASHPLLDFMNTYGIRLLMPLSERWFYGDALFIIDVWLWTALALGVWLSGRRWKRGAPRAGSPALISLCVTAAYMAAMSASSVAAERLTREAAEARGHGPIQAVVASPVPFNPFRREMVFATDVAYGFGVLHWTPSPSLQLQPHLVAINMEHPAIAEGRKVKAIADFLYWSRLPLAKVEGDASGSMLTVTDARYSKGAAAGQFTRTVRLPSAKPPAVSGAQGNSSTGD